MFHHRRRSDDDGSAWVQRPPHLHRIERHEHRDSDRESRHYEYQEPRRGDEDLRQHQDPAARTSRSSFNYSLPRDVEQRRSLLKLRLDSVIQSTPAPSRLGFTPMVALEVTMVEKEGHSSFWSVLFGNKEDDVQYEPEVVIRSSSKVYAEQLQREMRRSGVLKTGSTAPKITTEGKRRGHSIARDRAGSDYGSGDHVLRDVVVEADNNGAQEVHASVQNPTYRPSVQYSTYRSMRYN